MNTGDALLHACLDDPDDDLPRLVYADWLQENGEPERAEFIRLQVVIARHWCTGDIPVGAEGREIELRSAHEAEWNPLPASLHDSSYFERGFIGHVSVSTDEEAAAVARCPEVLRVSVAGEGFTDAGLAHLAALPFLAELTFHGGNFTGGGMRALAQHPRLRRIKHNGGNITGPWLHALRDTPRLVRIRTNSTRRNEPEEWTAWEKARAERFRRLPIEDQRRAARAFLFGGQECEEQSDGKLRLIQCYITDADVELLGALPELQNLDLYDTAITSRGLWHFPKYAGLRNLRLGNNAIDNLDGLAGMIQLRELSLIGMHVYHADVEWPLTDAGTAALSTLTGLEALDLRFNPITDVTLERLAGLTNLRKLELGQTNITDSGLLYLRNLKNLEYLDLQRTSVTAEGAKKLRVHLPRVKIKRVSSSK